jgi:hypothetical protein
MHETNRLDNGRYGIAILFYDRHGNVCEAIYNEDEEWEVRQLKGHTDEMLYWPGGLNDAV